MASLQVPFVLPEPNGVIQDERGGEAPAWRCLKCGDLKSLDDFGWGGEAISLTTKTCGTSNLGVAIAAASPERRLQQLGNRLMTDLKKNAERMTIRTRDGHQIAYDELYASRSKPMIDDIDAVLAEHFAFSAEELDMIVNFDAKFRMGGERADDGGD